MRQLSRSLTALLVLVAACTLCTAPALADPLPGQDQESRLLSDRLNVSLGFFQPDFSTNVAAGFGGLLGAFINVERQLNVTEDLGVFRLDGFYRFKPKHAIDWTYTVLNRDGTTVIDERIEWGEPPMEFRVGAVVDSTFDTTLFAVNYKYSFVNNGKIDAGVSAGLFTYKYELELAGAAAIVEPPGQLAAHEVADTRLLAPLPAFGMYMQYAVRKNLIFSGNIRALNIEFGDFTGKFLDSRFTLDWFFYKHLGIGVGFARTSIDFKDQGSDPFSVDYEYGGFLAYASIVF